MQIHIKIFNPQQTVSRILDNSVGIFTAETWGRYFSPYVPMQSGMLDQTRKVESFKVIYEQDYAKKMYNGDNFNFSKEHNPLATSHWDRPSFSANKNKVAKDITDYIARK